MPRKRPLPEHLQSLGARFSRKSCSADDVGPRNLSLKQTVQLWSEWVARGMTATQDSERLFTLIAQSQVGQRLGRIERRMRKGRPKP